MVVEEGNVVHRRYVTECQTGQLSVVLGARAAVVWSRWLDRNYERESETNDRRRVIDMLLLTCGGINVGSHRLLYGLRSKPSLSNVYRVICAMRYEPNCTSRFLRQ